MENTRTRLIDMSDYNRGVRAYWWITLVIGFAVVGWAVDTVARMDASGLVTVVAMMGLVALASIKPTRVPGTQVVITPGDIFVFLAAIVRGPAAATLVAVCESFCVSFRKSQRWTSRLGGPALMAIAISISARLFDSTLGWLRDLQLEGSATLLGALLGFALVYFLLNSMLLATHQALKKRETLLTHWRGNYSWAGLTYLASAAAAGLIHLSIVRHGIAAILAAAPLIAVIFATSHFYFKQAEERLKAGERMSLILNNTPDVIFAFNMEGRVTYVNPAVQALTGYSVEAASHLDFFSLAHDRPALTRIWRELMNGERCSGAEFLVATKNGNSKWCSGSWGPIYNEQEQQIGVQGHLRDISEQKDLQAQLFHSQKMEAIGRLAGGIAHDFNNLLTAIMGYSQMSLAQLDRNSVAYERLEQVIKASERAASLTKQLLAFSRRQMLQPAVLDLNALVDDVNKMLRRLIGEDTELVAIFSPALSHVKADPGQIEQVIINLAVNARDAMPNGGRLTIQTVNVHVPSGEKTADLSLAPGDYVMLSVSDTGCGMDARTASQVFEPFFTTKEKGKGTGLGLSTAYGIVKQSGGEITVESELGKGTTFRIYLPRAVSQPDAASFEDARGITHAGTETILVVEDDETLLDLTTEILSKAGYNALPASNAGEALLHCERYDGEIHLMLTDLVMPQMNGRELAERVASLRSSMKVLFMSGYTDDSVARHGISIAEKPFLQKPFTPESLSMKVREVLDQRSQLRLARN
ncbi:MAG TPA: ATP-binding protein [Blastocatellia bacterium]|nr:ATP-binding protein [Blastocatellia bacterium]